MKAVIDRFEGAYAVLLCGDDEVKVDFPRSLLPENATEGDWLTIAITPDPEGTRKQEEKVRGILERLKNKNVEN